MLISCAEYIVKRPSSSLKAKRRSGSRLSFGLGESAADEAGNDVSVFKPKKSALSRKAIEKNAERKARALSLGGDELVLRNADFSNNDYHSDKNSAEENDKENDTDAAKPLEIESKFGAAAITLSHRTQTSSISIPTDAEIREKKERRARLAREYEADHIALEDDEEDDSNSDTDVKKEITLREREKYSETRLLRDDEDMAEGFDEFVSDGNITLGKRAEREAKQKRRTEMAAMIAEAEGGGGSGARGIEGDISGNSSVDESEEERNAAFEAAQTRSGTYSTSTTAQNKKRAATANRSQIPPRITPIPDLSTVLQRFKDTLAAMQQDLVEKEKRLEELNEQKKTLNERGDWIQEQLKEAGERFEKMKEEVDLPANNGEEAQNGGIETNGTQFRLLGAESAMTGRGLETFGSSNPNNSMTAPL